MVIVAAMAVLMIAGEMLIESFGAAEMVRIVERKLSKAERRVKELAKSRDSWKAKHASAQSRPEVWVAGSETASEAASAPPAAPAPHAAMAVDTATEPAGQ